MEPFLLIVAFLIIALFADRMDRRHKRRTFYTPQGKRRVGL